MSDLSEKLAGLSPEKRQLLIQKLREQKKTPSAEKASESKTDFINSENDNFCCEITNPGNFTNLKFKKTEKTTPAPGQIQICAKAASLNFRDLMIAMNLYPAAPGIPSIMGSDYSGVVTEVGEGVSEFSIGDSVIALAAGHLLGDGTLDKNSHFTRYINVSKLQAVNKPDSLSFAQAASIPTVFLTAYFSICKAAYLSMNEKILIHTATGGVGLAAIQIARSIGAEIFATAGSDEKRSYLKSIGIENVFDSRTLDFAPKILDITDGNGVDVVLNTLSGDASDKGTEILGYFGRFLQVDKKDIFQNKLLPLAKFNKGLSYIAIDLSLFFRQPEKLNQLLTEIMENFRSGQYEPIPFTSYPIMHLGEALTYMSRSKHIGKIALEYE